ncbi:hypothetical protein [Leisingera sp. NJS201]|uniref:hypothetical protein n=1 Tax=Leisingera sp. NJS201 TaxID=2508306 RepID=UPI0014309D91|nr:hypothetical protein [Leisingera sp. NJS201]
MPAADSIAAKLQRIRAVVAQTPDEDFTEDEHADDVLESAAEDISNALLDDDADGAQGFDDEDNDAIAKALDCLDLNTGAASASDAPAQDSDSLFAGLQDKDNAPTAADASETTDSHGAENLLAGNAEDEAAASKPAPARPARVRITKVKRADFDKAVASGRLEESKASEDPAPGQPPLSQEDEADLMRELAEVEAEILAASEDQDAGDSPALSTAQPPAQSTAQSAAASLADSDVSRLMAAADEKLEDPDTASSREAYSQLRAAVAATKAEGSAGGTTGSDGAKPYREDLASVVRPRRPESRPNASERPSGPASRPAPLKLVAEQRIDEGSTPQQPVRPRRVSAAVLGDETEGNSGFASYAAERGAAELHELLEAAAAYMSFVEGRDHFSRPQLMNKVRSAGSSDFNREDGLRSFGQLLRDGKIERSGSGQFTASGDIGFKPGKRAAG